MTDLNKRLFELKYAISHHQGKAIVRTDITGQEHNYYTFPKGIDAVILAKTILADFEQEYATGTHWSRRLFRPGGFTRSNGSIASRLYERLTKASRRAQRTGLYSFIGERRYRQGVYDAFKALQEELQA